MWEIITGLISGVISGTGMGGGTILILVLSLFLGVEQHVAQATNLIFFIPTSIVAIIVSIKEKIIEWKTGIIIAFSGIVGAIIGALSAIAIYEIYSLVKQYKILNKRNNRL